MIAAMGLFASVAMAQEVGVVDVQQLKARYKAHIEAKDDNSLWCPGTQVYSSMVNDEWHNDRRYNTTYDSNGNILTDFNEDLNWTSESTTARYTSEVYTYSTYGKRLTGFIKTGNDKEALKEFRKFDFTYDEVVPTFITSYSSYTMKDGEWVKDKGSYKITVTRDEEGRVTQVLRSDWDVMGFYQDASKNVITYGEDGKPSLIQNFSYGEDWNTGESVWTEGTCYSDIVWKDCNNQILNGGALYQGANRILSAKLLSGGKENGSISVEYGPGANDYTALTESIDPYWGDKIKTRTEWREINPYNSFSILERTETYSEGSEEPSVSGSFESITRDAYGNLLEGLLTNEYYGMTSTLEHQTGEVVYDETYGYPLVYTESQMDLYDETKQVPFLRKEFSDYSNYREPTSIGNVAVDDNENAPVEYFNIQGVCVANLSKGLYIRRQGKSVQRVFIK